MIFGDSVMETSSAFSDRCLVDTCVTEICPGRGDAHSSHGWILLPAHFGLLPGLFLLPGGKSGGIIEDYGAVRISPNSPHRYGLLDEPELAHPALQATTDALGDHNPRDSWLLFRAARCHRHIGAANGFVACDRSGHRVPR